MRMTKVLAAVSALGLLLSAVGAGASVTVSAAPVSLVADPMLIQASSQPAGLFKLGLSASAGETLTSVAVRVNGTAGLVSNSDFASVALYKDDGSGAFSAASDTLVATQTNVNVATSTIVTVPTSTPATGTFFLAIRTSSSASTGDAFTVTLPADAVVASANSPALTAVTTAVVTVDATVPTLTSAAAQNTGSTSAKEAGDSVKLAFSEPTNKPAVTSANIGTLFTLNNSHTFLSTAGTLGAAVWDVPGTILTITLSGVTSTLPTVEPGDTVTVHGSGILNDLAGNTVTGSAVISGSFTATSTAPTGDDDDEEEHGVCANTLVNGKLYKVGSSATVYMAAACRLKPFRGAAVFHARGQKFQNITVLSALPSNVTISDKPVLPAEGTLIKGKARTVWFMGSDNRRHGFTSAEAFLDLGFHFGQVKDISDEDLQTISEGQAITSSATHPDGALIKCENAAVVFQIKDKHKFPFSTAEAFLSRGHSWDSIVSISCGRFSYVAGSPVTE